MIGGQLRRNGLLGLCWLSHNLRLRKEGGENLISLVVLGQLAHGFLSHRLVQRLPLGVLKHHLADPFRAAPEQPAFDPADHLPLLVVEHIAHRFGARVGHIANVGIFIADQEGDHRGALRGHVVIDPGFRRQLRIHLRLLRLRGDRLGAVQGLRGHQVHILAAEVEGVPAGGFPQLLVLPVHLLPLRVENGIAPAVLAVHIHGNQAPVLLAQRLRALPQLPAGVGQQQTSGIVLGAGLQPLVNHLIHGLVVKIHTGEDNDPQAAAQGSQQGSGAQHNGQEFHSNVISHLAPPSIL